MPFGAAGERSRASRLLEKGKDLLSTVPPLPLPGHFEAYFVRPPDIYTW